jgi:hypothetical protein
MANIKVHTPVANANTPVANVNVYTPVANVQVHTPVANVNTPVANVKVHTPVANVKLQNTPASGQPSTSRSAHISMIPPPEWTYNHPTSPSANDKTWPTNLIDIIRAIKNTPPTPRQPTQPEFLFKLTDKAAEKNYLTLMQKYNGNLAASLEHNANRRWGMAWSSMT